ncbi:lysophospholipid acyltransferase family protein [Patescibacteria group bacterium]|nr:lysophospholipid acyltransferase family protein [Patescibacteria group bacterium]
MIPHKNIIKDLGRIFFWYPLRMIVQAAPLNVAYLIGGLLGGLDYHVSNQKRVAKMSSNISLALGVTTREANRIVQKNLKMHMRNNLEFIKYPKFSKNTVEESITFKNIDRLDTALQRGKGVIMLTAHFGAKQLLQIALALKGYPINQIHYHMQSGELSFIQKHVAQRHRIKIEAQIPVNFIPANGFLRTGFKCLKDNQVLIMAGDGIGLKQHMNKSYCPFDIFGKQMLFPIGPAAMTRRTGAVLLPAFVVRQKMSHHIIFEPPLEVGSKKDQNVTADYVKLLEGHIRQNPWQWEFWEELSDTLLFRNEKQFLTN